MLREVTAFREMGFPCNPRPFIRALADLIADGKTTDSAEYRAVLWILISQSYGQCSTVDLMDEFDRLDKAIPRQ